MEGKPLLHIFPETTASSYSSMDYSLVPKEPTISFIILHRDKGGVSDCLGCTQERNKNDVITHFCYTQQLMSIYHNKC